MPKPFIVIFLPIEGKIGFVVLGQNSLFRFRQHSSGAAGRVVDLAIDARPVDILLASIDEVGHQANDLARSEVVASLLVRLLVEAHYEMLEQVSHLQVVDAIGMQVHIRHCLDDCEEPIAGVELFDLITELELLEDARGGRRETVDVGHEVWRNVFGIVQQLSEGERASVVKRVLARWICRLSEQPLHRVLRHLLCCQLLILLQHGVLGRLKDAIKPAQDDHGQHDQPVLRRAIRASESVCNFPDVGFEFVVELDVHLLEAFDELEVGDAGGKIV